MMARRRSLVVVVLVPMMMLKLTTLFLLNLSVVVIVSSLSMTSTTTTNLKNTRRQQQQEQQQHRLVTADSILLARQIQSCNTDVDQALMLLERAKHFYQDEDEDDNNNNISLDEGPYVQAISVCGNARRHDLALQVYQQNPSEHLRSLTISVCGKCGKYKEALNLLFDEVLVEGAEGQEEKDDTKNHRRPLPPSPPGTASYNAAIAACGHSGAWKDAISLLEQMPVELVSSTTCHAVLTVLGKARRGSEALNVLRQIEQQQQQQWNVTPCRTTYHLVIGALLREGDLNKAKEVFLECRTSTGPQKITLRQGTRDMIVAAFGKAGLWSDVRDLEKDDNDDEKKETINSGKAKGDNHKNIDNDTFYFQHWESLEKVGQGKGSYWALGNYNTTTASIIDDTTTNNNNKYYSPPPPQHVMVGFQPNRNPRKNGIRLVLVDEETGCKIGFLLMVNNVLVGEVGAGQRGGGERRRKSAEKKMEGSPSGSSSSLLGLRVEHSFRNQGWAKVLIAIWIHCCLEAGIVPITGKIHKPLIALLLEHHFGMVGTGGVICEAARPTAKAVIRRHDDERNSSRNRNNSSHHEEDEQQDDRIVLFSNHAKSLEGTFSPWDLQTQRIVLSDQPILNGRSIRVGATWRLGMDDSQQDNSRPILPTKVNQILQDRLSYNVTSLDLRRIFLGSEE